MDGHEKTKCSHPPTCRTACFYIGSSSLCSRYLIPSAPLQHRHKALFADVALHEIIVCGKQEAAPVLQSRHGVEHEIVLVAARNAEEADFHGFFPEEQRRILIRLAVQSAQFIWVFDCTEFPASGFSVCGCSASDVSISGSSVPDCPSSDSSGCSSVCRMGSS